MGVMSNPLWTAVDRYLDDTLVGHDPVLEAALAASEEAGLPSIQVAPNQGKMLSLFARMLGARRVLEIGTLGGYSTIWLARGVGPGGRVVTLESDPKHAAVARANLERAGVAGRVEIVVGRALETLPGVAARNDGSYDLFFVDADKESIPRYYEWCMKLAHPGSLIVVDNVVREGAVIEADSEDGRVQGVRRFNEIVAADPRVTATTIQTVGVKKHDGFAMVLVNDPAFPA